MEVIKNKRILALIGIICLLLGVFLPYITFSIWGYSQSISLWGYWEGKVVLVLTLANALFIFKDWIEKYIPQLFNNGIGRLVEKAHNPKFSLIPTILVAAFAAYMFIQIDVDSKYLKYGIGFWILWVGILSLIGHAIFYKGKKEEPTQQTSTETVYQNSFVSQSQSEVVNSQNIEPQVDVTKKYCPNCRTQVDANAQTCFMCGNRF